VRRNLSEKADFSLIFVEIIFNNMLSIRMDFEKVFFKV
jgi:hypothetical protein